MTLGVRIIVKDENSAVMLVRHGYVSGWHLPGGGVETLQTVKEAAYRELVEETGLVATGEMRLLSVFANRRASRRDHVVLYLCTDWKREHEFQSNYEIKEIGFFDRNSLPETTTQSTRDRLSELFDGRPASEYW